MTVNQYFPAVSNVPAAETVPAPTLADAGPPSSRLYEPTLTIMHPDWVNKAVFSSDGSLLATACHDGSVRLWNATTSVMVRRFKAPDQFSVDDVVFSPDNSVIAAATSRYKPFAASLMVWKVKTGELVHETEYGGYIQSLEFLPMTGDLVSAEANGKLKVWNTDRWTFTEPDVMTDEWIEQMVLSPDGKFLAFRVRGRTVPICELRGGFHIVRRLRSDEEENRARCIAFCADGRLAVAWNRKIGLSNVTDNLPQVLLDDPGDILSLASCADPELLVCGTIGGNVVPVDLRSGPLFDDLLPLHDRRVLSVAFSPDGRRIVSSSDDCSVRLYSLQRGIRSS
ncbi:WD40 repeat domain-containing protein [Kitasatospora purpeofusca]|uniref:WD40 repeat domain-containing protein n=1 Tax=Kitasatospora purpeofusca TaxID=67352 RepID=UPI0036555347